MFTRIVVGTDGSATADAAVSLAIELAQQSGAALYLVNAYRPRGTAGPSGAASPAANESLTAVASKEIAESTLEAARQRAGDLTVELRAVNGAPADAVVSVAQEVGADLIVVGSKGMQGARRLVLGSVPNSVAHNAPCHILIAKTA